MDSRWRKYFFDMCKVNASMSKDPSTKVGCVIVDGQKRVVANAYNGFPRGCSDEESLYRDREEKLGRTMHAESSAIIFAQRDLSHHSIFVWPYPPCDRCAAQIIQSGISRVYCPPLPAHAEERWGKAMQRAVNMFREAGVMVFYCHET